ncbi:MAG TPA: nuclear transport factor 2 family protein [Sphingomonadales bacterium]|nr:nuclear transport factor 2 family protein [Sphingomonadales bacterium]
MRTFRAFLFAAALVFSFSSTAGSDESAIRAVLEAQAAAWNRADLPGFMEGYWKSDELRFASGGSVTKGWQATFESYRRRYSTPEKMGTLAFSDLVIEILSPDAALVTRRFALARNDGPLQGVFTLIFRKFDAGWRIVYDHSSEDVLPLAIVGQE